jgi:general secretion pathway protein A
MYLQFFNLKKEPFQITPDPSFLYLSRGHEQALASIIYGVEKRKGFILIIGAVGAGKTTILRAYIEKVEKQRLKILYIFNSNISYNNLLRHILRELGIVPESEQTCDMVDQLHGVLTDEYKKGRTVLLLIDEAQNMPVDTLENLRMLSNLETANEKLIQIVFSAQPEFEKTLNLEELKQLKQRVALKANISRLTQREGLTYIRHRLKTAADKETVIFTNGALKEIVKVAKGIPRVINVVCDNSLITAYGYGKDKVDRAVVKEITCDLGMQRPFQGWWQLVFALGVMVILGGYFGIKHPIALSDAKPPLTLQTVKLQPRQPSETYQEPEKAAVVSEKTGVTRTVEKGDTLALLIKDVYGHVNPQLIRMVKKANPEIGNENLIITGGRIVFPAEP